jgi:hypothetical protein
MLECASRDPEFLKTVVTGDEPWVYKYDLETTDHSSQWKHPTSPRSKKARQVRSNVKVILFSSITRVLSYQGNEYAPLGQTVSTEYYQEVFHLLCDAVPCKRPELWDERDWQLHYESARSHSSHLVQGFLAEHSIPQIRQTPYSPDKASCDFCLFPRLKTPLKGSCFDRHEDIMQNAMAQVLTIQKQTFPQCLKRRKDRWVKCMES